MANYKSTTVSGDSWCRANRVIIDNPYNNIPCISFVEEKIFLIDDENITKQAGCIFESLTNPAKEFPLLNPETGEELGMSSKYMDVYVMMHSLYIFLAKERDKANEPIQEVIISEPASGEPPILPE